MPTSPYSADGLACARATLTNLTIMGSVTAEQRVDLVGMAFEILHKDRAARLGLQGEPLGPARVITIPRAVFQAGRPKPRRRPRLLVLPACGPTPGDAA